MINETKPLRWKKEVPNKEGWYWHKTSKKTGDYSVEIVRIEHNKYWQWHAWSVGNDSHFLLDDCKDDFWAGPIQEPKITIIGSEVITPDYEVNKYPNNGWRQFITKIPNDGTIENSEKKKENNKSDEEVFEITFWSDH